MTGPYEPEGQRPAFEPMPSAPAPSEREVAGYSLPRPKSVDNAFMLWLISVGISVLSIIVTLTIGRSDIEAGARDSLKNSNKSFTEDDVSSLTNISIAIAVVISLIFIGLYLLFAYKMRAGRNWARITLTVLGALGIVFTLASLSSSGGVEIAVRVIQAVVVVVAIYFMFRPDSNQYFNAARTRR
jgi:hypothetical protein